MPGVGAGGSQEAAFTLVDDVAAGTYHLVLDGIVAQAVDVQFTLIWRRGGDDTVLAQWGQHVTPLPGGSFDAQAFEYDEPAPAITWQQGDQLVFRYAGMNSTNTMAYIPNGEGAGSHGRHPNITLPQ